MRIFSGYKITTLTSIILFSVILCSLIDFSVAEPTIFPSPGFIVGHGSELALKVIAKVESIIACTELTFNDLKWIEKPFRLVENRTVNEKSIWHNGEFYLSYLYLQSDSNAPHGTWLVGRRPGIQHEI